LRLSEAKPRCVIRVIRGSTASSLRPEAALGQSVPVRASNSGQPEKISRSF